MCIQCRVIELSILAGFCSGSMCHPKLLTLSIKYKPGKPRFTCGFHVIENFVDGSWSYRVVSGNCMMAARQP